MKEVVVWQMAMDEKARIPVVILREKDGDGKLPIWIGTSEAGSIAMHLNGKEFPRPMTHDLTMTMVKALKADLRRVEIASLKESTYFARIILQREQELISVDARPSDCIALAVRANAPILVAEDLLDYTLDEQLPASFGEGNVGGGDPSTPEHEAERLRRRIRDLGPEDFGRFRF